MFVIATRYRVPAEHFEERHAIVHREFNPLLAQSPGFVEEVRLFGGTEAGRMILCMVAKWESEAAMDAYHRRRAQQPGWPRFQQLQPEPPEVLFSGEIDVHVVASPARPARTPTKP